MAHPNTLSARELLTRLFSPEPPVVIDIRVPDDLEADKGWFPAAHRIGFRDMAVIETVAADARDIVIICQGGLKLSQGMASRLARPGRRASTVTGGLVAWRDAGLPLWQPDLAPGVWAASWEKTAEMAATLWLANRLLPRPYEILLVAPDQVELAADRFGAKILPDATTLLACLDRPVPPLAAALAAAESDVFRSLCDGHARRDGQAWQARTAADLDALALGQPQGAAA